VLIIFVIKVDFVDVGPRCGRKRSLHRGGPPIRVGVVEVNERCASCAHARDFLHVIGGGPRAHLLREVLTSTSVNGYFLVAHFLRLVFHLQEVNLFLQVGGSTQFDCRALACKSTVQLLSHTGHVIRGVDVNEVLFCFIVVRLFRLQHIGFHFAWEAGSSVFFVETCELEALQVRAVSQLRLVCRVPHEWPVLRNDVPVQAFLIAK